MVGAFFAIEREILAHAPPPTIVFVGSSRARDAVAPRQLEAALGLPHGAVLNLAFTGGTPYEALLFFQRHDALLRGARVLVIGVEDWYWNDGFPPSQVERAFATFRTRWNWFRRRGQLGDLVGGLWRSYEYQEPLMRWGISFVRGVHRQTIVEDRVTWRTASQVSDIGPERIDPTPALEDLMQSYRAGSAYEESLRELVTIARSNHTRVVLTQIPLRSQYYDALERRFPTAQPHMRRRVAAIADESGTTVRLFARGSDIGIPDDRFYDYGHLTEDGCRRMIPTWVSLVRPLIGGSIIESGERRSAN
jgi:hypothetical protein